MAQVILPEEVRLSLELEGQLERLGRVRDRGAELRSFEDALKQIDPLLSLVRASEQATAPGLTPGYWHIRRQNDPPAMDSYLILTGPEGEFSEPHSGHLEYLRSRDLQRPGALEELQRQAFEKERERQSSRNAFRADRKEEFLDRYKAKANPGVLFGDNKWSWRTSGKRGRG